MNTPSLHLPSYLQSLYPARGGTNHGFQFQRKKLLVSAPIKDQFLGPRRVHQIQRAARNGAVRFLCLLFIAVVVLRGTIGAAKFETTLEQNFNEIRGQRMKPHRILQKAQPKSESEISRILVAE